MLSVQMLLVRRAVLSRPLPTSCACPFRAAIHVNALANYSSWRVAQASSACLSPPSRPPPAFESRDGRRCCLSGLPRVASLAETQQHFLEPCQPWRDDSMGIPI